MTNSERRRKDGVDEATAEAIKNNEIIKEGAEAEKDRLTALLSSAGTAQELIDVLDPVIENTAWMKAKLDDARRQIKSSGIVIPYDNGGGQKGLRENPLFRGYESLWRSYMSGMTKIIDALPEGSAEKDAEACRPKTMLEIVRERHKSA